MIKFASVAMLALALTQSLQATPMPISGSIAFSGDVTLGSSTSPGSVNAGNATEVVNFINPVTVGGASGTFASYITSVPTPAIFTSGTWSFNDSTAINNFWMVDGFTFTLNSSHIVSQGYTVVAGQTLGSVTVAGTGTVIGNGYAQTTMSWQFTTQDPSSTYLNTNSVYNGDTIWSFSASDRSSVPDGGATVMLLGIALSGVALLKKKFMA